MKKPKGITLLAIFLGWGIINILFRVLLNNNSVDVQILDNYGLLWSGYVVFTLILIFNVIAFYGLLKKKRWAEKALYIFFALNVIETVFVGILALQDINLVKDITFESRASRGLDTEMVDFMSPMTTIGIMVVYVVFYAFLALYVRKHKEYFSSQMNSDF